MIRHAAGFHNDPCFLVVVSDVKVDLKVQEVSHAVAEVHMGGGAAVPGHVCILLCHLVGCPDMENTWDVKHSLEVNRKGRKM